MEPTSTAPPKRKREPIPQVDVLDWLHTNHPKLHETCEIDRAWLWVTENLKEYPEVRKSLSEYGFIFARRGGHKLPSGALGTWGHSCEAPLPFKRKKKRDDKHKPEPTRPATPPRSQSDEDAEAAAFAGLA